MRAKAREDLGMTAESPRGWVHPDAAGEPAVEIFRPWPEQPKEPTTADMPARWEVITRASSYLLDLDACTVTRRNLDVRDLAPGAVHAHLGHDGEVMTLLAVPECRVGRPMFLLLVLERDGRVATVRVTTEVRSITADPE